MAIKRFYERAAEFAFLPNDEADASEATIRIINLAGGIDSLVRQLADDSRRMAELFARYAIDVEAGRRPTPPTAWSTIHDVDRAAVKLEEKRDALLELVRVTQGITGLKRFRDELDRLHSADAAAKAAS